MAPIPRLLLLAGLLSSLSVASPTLQHVLASPDDSTHAASRKLHGRFLHISDFHPDEFYKPHTSTEEGTACHRKSGVAGFYGAETSDCDSPISLINATFDWIATNLNNKLDFVIWTGDSARHDSDEEIPRSQAQVLGTNRLMASKFDETFVKGMGVPVIPTFGNNDILPHNILLPGPNKWLNYYTDIWHPFIPEEQRHSFEHGGWFWVEVVPKRLAVFSLNTLYFFDRNAAVDDCVRPSEPGFQQLEWLRVQLQFLRNKGMKAILMGHVPPARTDSKQNWDETCWQKYTLWLKQYRDVVAGAVYGHMNIDHFVIQDSRNIDFGKMTVGGAESAKNERVAFQEADFHVSSAADYLHDLRSDWSKLPNPASVVKSLKFDEDDMEVNEEEVVVVEDEADTDKKKKKKGGKNGKNPLKKLGGRWAERYQLSLVSPSVVPNYFPTLRVIEYNITGLDESATWADALENPNLFSSANSLFGLDSEDLDDTDDLAEIMEDPKFESEKKRKKKKGGKKKKEKKPDPNLVIPDSPAKSSPPGPAYSPQTFTFTGYTQYFANLTLINNDIADEPINGKEEKEKEKEREDDVESAKWREGIHKDKEPKNKKPRPKEFQFEVEYSTFTDKVYKLKDLTVKSYVHLAYRIGKNKKSKSTKGKESDKTEGVEAVLDGISGDELAIGWDEDGEDFDELGDWEEEEDDLEDDVEDEDEDEDEDKLGTESKKKERPKNHHKNKVWMEFLSRAFVGTLDKSELKQLGVGDLVPEEAVESIVVVEGYGEL